MNRLLLLVSVVFLILVAGPATAHTRDPFEPLVSAGTSGTTTTDGDTSAPEPPPMPAPDAEGLPNTGARTSELAGLALALIGLGAATMVAVSARRPRTIPQRAGSVA